MPKRGQKKPNGLFKGQKKAKLYLRYCHSLSQKTSKLKEYQKNFSSKLELNLAWLCSGALIFPDFSWFVQLHTLGTVGPQFASWSTGNFLHESLSHSLLHVLAIRIIRALPLRRNYCISTAETQTCLQALRKFSAYNTIYITQCSECTHFQWLRKNLISNLTSLKYYKYQNAGVW